MSAPLKQPTYRQLRGGAHLHATKGYRFNGATVTTKHAGNVQAPGTGGTVRRKTNRPQSKVRNLLTLSHHYREEFNTPMPEKVVKAVMSRRQPRMDEIDAAHQEALAMVAGK